MKNEKISKAIKILKLWLVRRHSNWPNKPRVNSGNDNNGKPRLFLTIQANLHFFGMCEIRICFFVD